MRQSGLMSKAYNKDNQSDNGPNIQIKELPQIKKDLNYLRNLEDFKDSVYDDSTGNIVPKGTPLDKNGKLPSGGNPTIGVGHLVTPTEYDTIYQPGIQHSKSDLEDVLIRDYFTKKQEVNNQIKNSGKNPDDIPEKVKSILVRNSFWGVSKSSFPKYFDSMINGLYKSAADNLKFTDPDKGEQGGYTKIYSPEKGMSGLKKRTEEVMKEIISLYD